MIVNVEVKRFDLLEHKNEVLAKGKGILKGDFLSYFEESEERRFKHEVMFQKDHCVLKRFGDVVSILELHKNGESVAKVDSEYGLMQLRAKVVSLVKCEDRWLVHYRIYDGERIVVEQRLEWLISYVS